ncbi:MAG TPA: helix-hairpin-helix domain-containing protein [Chitinophaga sp.]|uniref:helix-hairpin-helix domain-containing protein n=1 Tax=Chitinophaga sp. TaxID=1869181 RepID=UPI002C10C2F8|nr:helix-hairpin-helix domain-containing protein [Chitinophaga sp.]HVI49502.1 helix-hairpin-helix domain-containing protein [Chitinophaga sp.]
MNKKAASSGNGFTQGLSQPAIRALHGAGYTKLEQLTKATAAELKQLHGMGPKALEQLRNALAEKGLAFRS